ncbi:MAG: hypothetical protein M5U27_14890 [Gaiella sp.]|nr:hypothetical protein [Gaiella sp.]
MADRTTQPGAREAPSKGAPARPVTDLARGRRSEMPFLLVGWTALVIGTVAGVIAGVALFVWWLG